MILTNRASNEKDTRSEGTATHGTKDMRDRIDHDSENRYSVEAGKVPNAAEFAQSVVGKRRPQAAREL